MAFTIVSSVGSLMSAATGHSTQGHLQYATNQGAYWLFYLAGTSYLAARYSTNSGVQWNTPTGSPSSFARPHASEGRQIAFAYANISGKDVLHMQNNYGHNTLPTSSGHARFTLGKTWTKTNAFQLYTENGGFPSTIGGPSCLVDSNNLPIDAGGYLTNTQSQMGWTFADRAISADLGSSWTSGFAKSSQIITSGTNCTSSWLGSLGSGNLIVITDKGTSYNFPSSNFTNLCWSQYKGTWSLATNIFSTNISPTDTNNWGAVVRTTSDIHLIALSDNAGKYIHVRFNGTSWSLGNTIANLPYGTNSGISLISDGINVWAAVIDKSNNIQVTKWTSGSGWGSWAVLTTRTNTPSYITGTYNAPGKEIMWTWTEYNPTSKNYDIVGNTLTTVSHQAGSLRIKGS